MTRVSYPSIPPKRIYGVHDSYSGRRRMSSDAYEEGGGVVVVGV